MYTQVEIATIVGSASKLARKVALVPHFGVQPTESNPYTRETLVDSNARRSSFEKPTGFRLRWNPS